MCHYCCSGGANEVYSEFASSFRIQVMHRRALAVVLRFALVLPLSAVTTPQSTDATLSLSCGPLRSLRGGADSSSTQATYTHDRETETKMMSSTLERMPSDDSLLLAAGGKAALQADAATPRAGAIPLRPREQVNQLTEG